ncbi:MAG: hypothetical protein AB7T63_12555 [Planctomycetota bacterium]
MPDEPFPPARADGLLPEDVAAPSLAALLAALAALSVEAEAEAEADADAGVAPDAVDARVVDEVRAALAAGDASGLPGGVGGVTASTVRELAVDLAGAEADVDAQAGAGQAGLPARLRDVLVALGAQAPGAAIPAAPSAAVSPSRADGSVAPSDVAPRGVALRVVASTGPAPSRRRGRGGWRAFAAAAAVLAGLFLWSPWSLRRAEARPGLSPTFVRRMDWASSVRRMPRGEPVHFLAVGSELEAGREEWMGVGFAGDALVVVDERAPLAIAPWPEGMDVRSLGDGVELLGGGRAVLAASRGAVRMTAGARALPVRLDDQGGLFVLLAGAAHVELDAGVRPGGTEGTAEIAAGHPVVALAEGSRGLWWPAGAGAPVELPAGERTLLAAEGVHPFGEAEASLFRELRFFGGDVPPMPLERRVPARALRFVSGAALAQGATTRVPAGSVTRWHWRVPDALACADVLRLDVDGPLGTTWRLPQLDLTVEARMSDATATALEPGLAPLELTLPGGWFERLEGRPLEIQLDVPAGERFADVHALVVRRPPMGAGPGEIGELLR